MIKSFQFNSIQVYLQFSRKYKQQGCAVNFQHGTGRESEEYYATLKLKCKVQQLHVFVRLSVMSLWRIENRKSCSNLNRL